MRSRCCATAAPSRPGRTAASRSGASARSSPTRCWKDIARQLFPLRFRRMARGSRRPPGTTRCGCGRSQAADGALVAAAGIRGSVTVIERASGKLARTLVGPGLPVWSVAFLPDNRTMLTGGTDRMVRRWDALTGDHIGAVAMGTPEDPLAAYAGDPGAEVFRACVACHTLSPDEGNRAGPTLAGVFGRRIATLPGYNFSDALKKLDIVWTPETVAKLFEVGPARYTPGTKMPEQTIGSPDERAALVTFLEKATKK